jgi:hypothetical protein
VGFFIAQSRKQTMLATVQIASPVSDDNPLGFIVINESDFDANTQELFGAEAVTATAKQMKEALTARGTEFKPNASKADLQALLDAAPAQ